jgi:hypothetical protein
MPKTWFLAFGGGDSFYRKAVETIGHDARALNWFDTVNTVTDLDLKNQKKHAAFYVQHGKFLEENKRGYGYWLWKPYLIKKQLEAMEENDILVYADARCTLNVYGHSRLIQYFDLVNKSPFGILSFQTEYLEKTYTKMDLLAYLKAQDFLASGQLNCTLCIIRKCAHSVKLVNKWYETCCIYDLINDRPSRLPNDATFKDHRHDQSVWSLLRKKYGSVVIEDETWFPDRRKGTKFPIWRY